MLLLDWIVAPNPRIQGEEARLEARLLAGIQAALFLCATFILIFVVVLDPRDLQAAETQAGIVWAVLALLLYAVTRAGYHLLSSIAFIIISCLTSILGAFLDTGNVLMLAFLVVPILMTSIFFELRWTALLAAILATTILLLNRPAVSPDFWTVQTLWYFLLFSSGLILVLRWHLSEVEKIRTKRLQLANQKLQEHEASLEMKVEQRTRELKSALEEVNRLNKSKDTFVANVSHELKTPLTSILINLRLAQEMADGKQARVLSVIKRETYRLNALIDALLKLSQLDLDQTVFHLANVNLNDLVENYVFDRIELAAEKGLTLRAEPASQPHPVRGDADLLGQVMSILLTNALNYTPEHGEVVVSLRSNSEYHGFEVADTGLGIPKQEQAQLFVRFFRGSTAHKVGTSGTGLGLAIAHEIVQRHRGYISVESTGIPGDGTNFTVWLPRIDTVG